MVITNKIIKVQKPNINELKTNMMKTMSYIRRVVEEAITNEFNEFYSDEDRINKYDWSKVARTSYLAINFNFPSPKFKNSITEFEIFKIGERSGIWYGKGEVLEKMILNIEYVD